MDYKIIQTDERAVQEKYGCTSLLAKVFSVSEIKESEIREILSGGMELTTSQADCIRECCGRILAARKNREKVFVGGDYDADGICSTAIMKKTLDKLGIQNGYYIPDRFKEGYGLHAQTVEMAFQKGYSLIITVDNGVKAHEALKRAKQLGMDIIVTDHHRIEEEVEADLVVHPDYMEPEYAYLSGAGVALEISRTLIGNDDDCNVFAAVAAIGDVMPLWKETRRIVKLGMSILKTGRPYPLSNLLYDPSRVNETTISFQIVPKLNSVGRMNDISNVNTLVAFLLCRDKERADHYIEQLNKVNDIRRSLSDQEARQAEACCTGKKIEIIYQSTFHEGLCGLVAGKLASMLHKPVIVMAEGEEYIKGSGRSVKGFDLFAFMSRFEELKAFGGHEQAVGLSVAKEDFESFRSRVYEAMEQENFVYTEPVKEAIGIQADEITFQNISDLEILSPCPREIHKPVFALCNPVILSRQEMNKIIKYRIALPSGDSADAILFKWRQIPEKENPQALIGRLSINRWMNRITCQMEIEQIL